nr:hypothetical protein [uncultured Allomuricauda sp.]
MKTTSKLVSALLILVLIFTYIGCSKDDNGNNNSNDNRELEFGDGVNLDEFAIDEGEIGINISSRDMARKGHTAITAAISVTSSIGDYDQEVQFETFSNIASLSFKNEDLTEEAEAELREGVPLIIDILDENGNVLATEEISKQSFTSNPSQIEINSNHLEDLYKTVNLKEDIIYFVQLVEENNTQIFGAPNSKQFPTGGNNVRSPIFIDKLTDLDYTSDETEKFTAYTFKKVPGKEDEDIYSMSVHDGSDIHYAYISNDLKLNIQTKANLENDGGNADVENRLNFQFKIEKIEPGLYTFTPQSTGIPIGYSTSGGSGGRLFSSSEVEPIFFRILSFDIDWDIVALDTRFMQPILPPSNTASEFNQKIRNCSSGTQSTTIGESLTLETKSIVGWEESMSVSSSRDHSISVTVEAEVSTELFGTGGSLKTSITEDYAFSTSRTSVSTTSEAFEKTESKNIFIERTQEIPPKTVILVADIYQSYENVRIPFVKRFRIKGRYQENDIPLTGNEILTQFTFNNFTGVVTNIQQDFIEVTVRGTNVINNLIDTETISENVEGGCDD